jgi:protoporphyrinogen oxidase
VKIAVIGAGPAGMTAAYELVKTANDVDVYEACSSVGGMAKTIELWNHKVDIGPHRFFSNDSRVNKLWFEVAGNDYAMVNRLTRIYYNNKFFHYPIKAFNALSKIGLLKAAGCVFYYGLEKISPTKDISTFEGWVTKRFGKKLYEIFFKTYTEKLWGIPCNMLDADFASQRIKKFSLGEAIKTALFGNSGKHKTLVEQFAYPFGGSGMIYERMAGFVKQNNGRVFINTPVKRVLTRNNTAYAIELEDCTIKEYDHVISSMPLTILVDRLHNVPSDIRKLALRLKYRNTIIVYLKVMATELFPDNWIYVHSSDLKMGRLTNFRNWVGQLNGDDKSTVCALEFWCYEEDEIWKKPDGELIDLAKDELKKTGLVKNADISDGYVHRINYCYPVYIKGYKEILKPIEDYLSSIKNIQFIGRYGSFKYNNQDHSILMGKLAAENIIQGKKSNLWEINTDYDNYQEEKILNDSF